MLQDLGPLPMIGSTPASPTSYHGQGLPPSEGASRSDARENDEGHSRGIAEMLPTSPPLRASTTSGSVVSEECE